MTTDPLSSAVAVFIDPTDPMARKVALSERARSFPKMFDGCTLFPVRDSCVVSDNRVTANDKIFQIVLRKNKESCTMKREVEVAIGEGIRLRRDLLRRLTDEEVKSTLERLFLDFFADQHLMLQKWAALTGQSAQVDTGYIAQFVASLVLREPGQGFRGKGDDLADGSEVKGAANISGVDRPRWNHNVGKPSDDRKRMQKGEPTQGQQYLDSPYLFYLLVDRVVGSVRPAPIRIRGWCIDAQNDSDWRGFFMNFLELRDDSQYNLQLHPPVGYDDNIVVNTLGNLDFQDVLAFDARIVSQDGGDRKIDWYVPLASGLLQNLGRTKSIPYGGRSARPTRLTGAEHIVADIASVPRLFPGILTPAEEQQLETVARKEAGESK